ncbi:MAG: bifunctional nuclease family protein [Tannerella sp.]|jgi:bifunctional DNase/RNase|nr:bifunctional nuclease family protein [Tannerella sp.]
MEDKKIKLRVLGITSNQIQSGAYALILSDEGYRRIPVIIGTYEAQSIAIALQGFNSPRPLTHDLIVDLIGKTGYRIVEIFIHKFLDGVFYSDIAMSDGQNTIHVDSRTSDAVAISLRTDSPIFTRESILDECNIVLEESVAETESLPEELTMDDLGNVSKLSEQLRALKKKDLKKRMDKAIAGENYEFAKIYRDELARRDEDGKTKV